MDEMMHMANRLSHYKKINPDIGLDHFELGRHTYCHLMLNYQGQWHRIEVRAFNITYDYSLIEVSAVNWTLAAGTCTLRINPENVKDFKILEDEPTMQVLYG